MAGQTSSDPGVDVGQVLDGKYRIDAILGKGGMGVVLACTHLGLNERYAIKMLRPDVMTDVEAVERFTREARAAAKLKSEYVAKVSDVVYQDGVPFMVMEFLEGEDVGQLLDERQTLAIPWATELVLQAGEALAEAHSIGIVHRDVKPSNLFVTWRPDGTALVKVLDFGISKSPMGTDMKLTQTQSVLGTPAYMSPEQMRSAHTVDARSDIWSLGSVLYEMIEGHRAFEAESFSEMCVKVAVDPPQPMLKAPPPLAAIVLRCLEKRPEDRFQTVAELGEALVPFAQNAQMAQQLVTRMTRVLGRTSNVSWDPPPDASLRGAMTLPVGRAKRGRRTRWPLAVAVVAIGAIGAALVVVKWSAGPSEAKPTPAAVVEPPPQPQPTRAPDPPAPAPTPVVTDPAPAPTPVVVQAKPKPQSLHHPKPAVVAPTPPTQATATGSAVRCDVYGADSQHGCKP